MARPVADFPGTDIGIDRTVRGGWSRTRVGGVAYLRRIGSCDGYPGPSSQQLLLGIVGRIAATTPDGSEFECPVAIPSEPRFRRGVENGETGQMHNDAAHSLPGSELGRFEQELWKCMISHLEPR